ncbi:MAG: ABC transporter substrate-binding protein [Syntrophobacteraceae bacterium]
MKWNKWWTLSLALVTAVALTLPAYASTLSEIQKRGELIVACQTQGPPFSFVDKNGKRTGAAIELCELLAKEMGVKVKFLNYDWDGIIPALLSKKADMLAADMTPTIPRAMQVAFTTPYVYTGSVVFTKAGSPLKTLKDCKKPGLTIAVLLGSTGETDARKNFPDAKIKAYKGGGPLVIQAVLSGHADFGVNDKTAVYGQMASFPPNSLRVLPGQLTKTPLCFAVRYDSPDLLRVINQFFLNSEADGNLNKILDYWVNSLAWTKDH